MLRSAFEGLIACTLVALALSAGVVSASCPGEFPQVVLECFSAAYSDRDLAVLEGLLAPDYIWVAVSPPEVDVFPREDSVSASTEMFNDPEVEFVSLEFDEVYRVVDGEEANTWRLEDLRATMTVKRASMQSARSAILCVTLYVRLIEGDDPGFEVYREVFFEGEGCVGK